MDNPADDLTQELAALFEKVRLEEEARVAETSGGLPQLACVCGQTIWADGTVRAFCCKCYSLFRPTGTRFPLVVAAVNHLKVRSCLIDGEVVCCDERGLAIFSTLRQRGNEARAFLYAF
jgi:hypothetical protein